MKIVDLSMTIQPHWRWKTKRVLAKDLAAGDPYQVSVMTIQAHAFTHMDTPLHVMPDQITADEVPVDRLAGTTAVLDLTHVQANEKIGAETLKAAGAHIEPEDIVLLKTGWDLKYEYTSHEYWLNAPYLDEEAAQWLAEKDIKAVGFDFPQDHDIRKNPVPPPSHLPTHHLILTKGIYLIEYLCNVHEIEAERVNFFALPLKIKGAEGGPVRAFAVID